MLWSCNCGGSIMLHLTLCRKKKSSSSNLKMGATNHQYETRMGARKWCEPRSNIPWLKKIIWVIGVLRRTVVGDWRFDNLSGYGKPNGAKFKRQNCLHIQQICYQGQDRFSSSSCTKIKSRSTYFLSRSRLILIKLSNKKLTHSTNFNSTPTERVLRQAQEMNVSFYERFFSVFGNHSTSTPYSHHILELGPSRSSFNCHHAQRSQSSHQQSTVRCQQPLKHCQQSAFPQCNRTLC